MNDMPISSPRSGSVSGQLTSSEIDMIAILNSLEPTPPGHVLIKTENGFENVPIEYVSNINRSNTQDA
jgi:hypothetical protein